MTRQLGTIDYLGTSGGFTVRGGKYIGTSLTVSLNSSGLMSLSSQNGDLNVFASGTINAEALNDINLLAHGMLNVFGISGIFVTSALGDVSVASVKPGHSVYILGPQSDNAGTGGGILINASTPLGAGLFGLGSISGIAGREIHLHASGLLDLVSQNGNIDISASGVLTETGRNGVVITAVTGDLNLASIGGALTIQTTPGIGDIFIDGDGIFLTASDAIDIIASAAATLQAGIGSVLVTSTDGDATLKAQAFNKATIVRHDLGPVKLLPWNSSGQLEYLFGPNEAWATRPSYLAVSQPIPYSGQIIQMILENQKLQTAYGVNPKLNVLSSPGNLAITAVTAKPVFGSNSTYAELNISGQLNGPTTNHELGDIWSVIHGMGSGLLPDGINTAALVKAKSLGIGELIFNTGSGIINLNVGSGITQLTKVGVQTFSTLTPTAVTWTNLGSGVSDLNYGAGSSNIMFFSPGLYKTSFKINLVVSTTGTVGAAAKAEIYHTSAAGVILPLADSKVYTSVARVLNNRTSLICPGVLFNAQPGDQIDLRVSFDAAFPPNGAVLSTLEGEANLIVERIGPQRI